MKKYILACESSCDETAFAMYDIIEKKIISSVIFSQSELHNTLYGGVFPELASELHFSIIDKLFSELIKQHHISLNNIAYGAATYTPGLPGALTIGFTFIKALTWQLRIPFIPINHLEGHIFSTELSHTLPFPYLCFSLSGGHTNAYVVTNTSTFSCVGQTRDDACGECFDKIAKLLRLGYPGGQKIEKLASTQILQNSHQYPISDLSDGSISFSGLKTAVLYDIKKRGWYDEINHTIHATTEEQNIISIATSVQYVINEMIIKWVSFFLSQYSVSAISVVGGVACNVILVNAMTHYVKNNYNIPCFTPQKKHCGDNAEMIAYVAYQKVCSNLFAHNTYDQTL